MPEIFLDRYLAEISAAMRGLDSDIEHAFNHLRIAKANGRRVLVLGNGGSLAIAQHFAQDLLKLCRVRAWTINCPSMITAHANDDGFEMSYYNPAMKLLDEHDPIIMFSCSGKSRNYIEFFSDFGKVRNPVISIVGTDGGFMKTKSQVSIHVKSNDYQVCETAFCVIADVMVKGLLEDGCLR